MTVAVVPTAAVTATRLCKRFGDVTAVDALSLTVAPGEIYGLLGPDGAGKTTTLRLLAGLLTADAGEVLIFGDSAVHQPALARRHIGYMAQRFSLYGDLTVSENVRFFAEMNGVPQAEWQPRTQSILEFVGLAEFSGRRAEQLSGGMKQKLALAVALAHRPRLLLMDEPTGGVDPVTRQDFWQLIIRLAQQDRLAVLVSTPYMDEAARCTRVGFLSGGRLLREGRPAALTAELDGRILELSGSRLRQLAKQAVADPAVEDAQVFGDRLHLRITAGQAEAVLARLPGALQASGGEVTRLAAVAPTLEDAFIELLDRSAP